MSKPDEGDDLTQEGVATGLAFITQQLLELKQAEQRVTDLRAQLRATHDALRAALPRVRKAKTDKPKPGRPKGSKNGARKVHAEPSSQPAE